MLQANDYASRGRLSDYSENHDTPFEYAFLGIGVIILLIFAIIWLYSIIKKHKETILNAIGSIFVGILGLGAALLIAKCGQELKNNNYGSPHENETNNESIPMQKNISEVEEVNKDVNDPWAAYPPVISGTNNEPMKENDFMVAAINNPTFTIYDFLKISGLNTSNTQLLSYDRYCRSNFIRQRYDPTSFRVAYTRVQRAWNILCRLQNIDLDNPDISKYMMEYSPFDVSAPRIENSANPGVIKDLKIIPLQD